MKSGQPLNDADRAPWLAAIGAWIDGWVAAGQSGVISCSALKRAYRDTLDGGRPAVRFVFIDLDEATIADAAEGPKARLLAGRAAAQPVRGAASRPGRTSR